MAKKKNKKNKKDIEFVKTLKLLANDSDQLIAYLKGSQAILKSRLWEMVHAELDESSSEEIRQFLEDGDMLRKLHDEALEGANRYQSLLKELSWEMVLASFAAYLEAWYFNAKNDQQYESKRNNLIPVLQRVAVKKNQFPRKNWGSRQSIDSALDSIRDSLLNGEPIKAYSLFAAWDAVLEVEAIIKDFCYKGWEVSHASGLDIKPESLDAWKAWALTNHKFQIIDRFYREFPYIIYPEIVEDIQERMDNEVTVTQRIEALGGYIFIQEMLGVDEVEFEGVTVDLRETIDLIGRFDSCYKSNYLPFMERMKNEGLDYANSIVQTMQDQISQNMDACIRQGLNPIAYHKEIMGNVHHPCISVRTSDEMLEMMMQYDQIPPDAARRKACLTALELFAGPPHMGGVDNGQFMRTPKNNYIIIPRFFHGDVKTALLNRIVRKKGSEKGKGKAGNKPYSANMEHSLAQRFESQGYKAIASWDYKNGESQKGEVDVIAYKDGYLFIVEAKLTYFRTDVEAIYRHEQELEGAVGQLNRALEAIKANFNELRQSLMINEDLSDLQIVPLIVSNSPEFDFKKYSGIPKLSQFELQCLLDPGAFIFAKTQMSIYNEYCKLTLCGNQEEQRTAVEKLMQGDQFVLENKKKQEQYLAEAELIASQPERLIGAINSKYFWQELEENTDVVSGPIEQTFTMKNGDEIRYVV
ncbi:PDDEXK family nuclease [Pseudodesulfovibrio piezophilus]|uniref:NERD domain-containing protein n=1 Tax=Pseudodesulfovibrio piezophilus (strain DSM 21447 / JCM 15486 / C1TLV30) TaxID=1322246 RepID=M1WME9_PSEP2|nr:hypothetical protein [Pseudodesulfovibrio piezophilus]CCH49485.1 protein of unknown function [Pseudodesulfovibrio piezophilus C1TLV30]